MSADGTDRNQPTPSEHELRTFFLGPHVGVQVECWCGWVSEHEFIDQEKARREHDRHRAKQEGLQ